MKNKIASNVTSTQEVHRQYGGVVPELASRVHQQHIVPVVDKALKEAGLTTHDLSAIAVTAGPGLIGSLLVGLSFAKGLCVAANKPLIGVNHMQAHVAAHYIDNHPSFPFICLTVSGGHTQIVLVKDYLDMHIIGHTLDDAAGEAFDKAAKIMGLPYPGGPLIDKYAQNGNPVFQFPEPAIPGYDFSFSGLKTAFLYFIKEQLESDPLFVQKKMADICCSVQHRIVSILMNKLVKAVTDHNVKTVALAGGVSANSLLRQRFFETGHLLKWQTHVPAFEYCTDNAAMIAAAGFHLFKQNKFSNLDIVPAVRMPF